MIHVLFFHLLYFNHFCIHIVSVYTLLGIMY